MVHRYFLHISYNGFDFRGWQRQDKVISIQETLENALEHILGENISLIGCGRTDAQVHATQYFAHMDTEIIWDYDLAFRLNQLLPKNIALHDIIKMNDFPHARFDVTSRTYEYYIHTLKNPFLNEYSYFFPCQNINFDLMKLAADLLIKNDDFISFCKTPGKNQTTICKIYSTQLQFNKTKDQIRFEITANRFLRGMIRSIVQYLLEIGTGKFSIQEFEDMLIEKRQPAFKATAAPYGLYLSKINYTFLDLKPYTNPPPFNNSFH